MNGLLQCLGRVDSFNRCAALDHRATSLASLRSEIDGANASLLTGPWAVFANGRWPSLRLDAMRLYDLIAHENPKLFGLAFALESLHSTRPGVAVRIRVGSQAAAQALETDLRELLPECTLGPGGVTIIPWSERLPWADNPLVELLPGLPPRTRHSLLWSREATEVLGLYYAAESEVASHAIARSVARQRQDY